MAVVSLTAISTVSAHHTQPHGRTDPAHQQRAARRRGHAAALLCESSAGGSERSLSSTCCQLRRWLYSRPLLHGCPSVAATGACSGLGAARARPALPGRTSLPAAPIRLPLAPGPHQAIRHLAENNHMIMRAIDHHHERAPCHGHASGCQSSERCRPKSPSTRSRPKYCSRQNLSINREMSNLIHCLCSFVLKLNKLEARVRRRIGGIGAKGSGAARAGVSLNAAHSGQTVLIGVHVQRMLCMS